MKNRLLIINTLTLITFLGLSVINVFAQSGGPYELTWTSIDGGGGAMTGGAYSLVSSLAQPEPGNTQSGGAYSLNGGVIDAGNSGQISAGDQRLYIPMMIH